MLNKIMTFVGTEMGKKVLVGGAALLVGAGAIAAVALKPKKVEPAVDPTEPIEVEGEVVEEKSTDEETTTEE